MDPAHIQNQTAIRSKNFNKLITKAITKEGYNRTRILYAGQNPNDYNTMVVFKVIELLKGKYYLEETVFNPSAQSVNTTMSSINREKFDRITSAKEKMFEIEFRPTPNVIAGSTYSRKMGDGKTFHNMILKDFYGAGLLTKMLLKNYLNKKW